MHRACAGAGWPAADEGERRRRYHERTSGKILKQLGFTYVCARPNTGQDEETWRL